MGERTSWACPACGNLWNDFGDSKDYAGSVVVSLDRTNSYGYSQEQRTIVVRGCALCLQLLMRELAEHASPDQAKNGIAGHVAQPR